MLTQTRQEVADYASLAALADRCVQCGLCLAHCPTYRLDANEMESPRGRIAYVKALATGQIAASDTGDGHLDHCLACRRCESICPAEVKYGDLLIGARAAQFARRPLTGFGRWQLGLMARPGLLGALLRLYRRVYPMLPRSLQPLPRPSPPAKMSGPRPSDGIALFVGCVAGVYESQTRAALNRLLSAAGARAVIANGQTCCGTAALHAGDTAQAATLAQRNRSAFTGQTTVLSLASGCQDVLADSLRGVADVEDAVVFIQSRADRLQFRSAQGRRVALHRPCSQHHLQGGNAALLQLLHRVPDLDLIELADTGCCGAAGLHMLNEPERAAALRAPLLEAMRNNGATEILSANIGCRLHLGNGIKLPVRHPIDFLAEHLA